MSKSKIGTVIADFNEQGEPVFSVFVPSEFKVGLDEKLTAAPVRNETEAADYALRVLAAYFVNMGAVEARDPDLSKIGRRVLVCEKHTNGIPKHCEIEFYLESL